MSHNTQAPKTVLCIKIQITTIYTMCCTAYLNNVGKRHEEGGDLDLDRLWRTRGPVARRRRADDVEAEQTRRARHEGEGEQDFAAEISAGGCVYEEIRSSRDPRREGPCGRRLVLVPHREDDPG